MLLEDILREVAELTAVRPLPDHASTPETADSLQGRQVSPPLSNARYLARNESINARFLK